MLLSIKSGRSNDIKIHMKTSRLTSIKYKVEHDERYLP